MSRRMHILFQIVWALAGALLVSALALLIWYAPVDVAQGPIQKIMYLHLGTATSTLIAACGVLFGSVAFLWQRDLRWDRLADSSARAAVLLLFIVLMTGMIWARQAWGFWWEWSPPLTFSLILWVMYVVYMLIRRFHSGVESRASISATFGILTSLNVPLVYLSVQFLPKSHITGGQRTAAMTHTLLVWIIAIAVLTLCFIWTRYLIGAARACKAITRREPRQIKATPAGGRA